LLMVVICFVYPDLILWLPKQMYGG
jgi:hypothetical protein